MARLDLLLDARKLGDGGIGVYIENLVDGLLLLVDDGEINLGLSMLVDECALSSKKLARRAKERWEGRVRFISEPAKRYSLSEYLRLAHRQRAELKQHQIFHEPHYTLPLFLPIPSVATIHDVIHLTHPSTLYHEPVARTLLKSTAKRATKIITVSEHSRRVMQEQLPFSDEQISVIPNCVRTGIQRYSAKEIEEFRLKAGLTGDYCLFVGSERPHKGFRELVETWAELFNDVNTVSYPQLLVVGTGFSESSTKLVSDLKLSEVIHFFGDVSTKKLSLLYSGARALVLPSRAEGFGLPALEAMCCGCPVVATPLPSVKEFADGVAWFSSDETPASFARAVHRALEEAPRELVRIEQGKRKASELNLREHARSTWKVYQSILGQAFPDARLRKGQAQQMFPIGTSRMSFAPGPETGGL